MRSLEDDQAALELLRTVAAVPFTIIAHEVIPGSDEGEFAVRLELCPPRDRARAGHGNGRDPGPWQGSA